MQQSFAPHPPSRKSHSSFLIILAIVVIGIGIVISRQADKNDSKVAIGVAQGCVLGKLGSVPNLDFNGTTIAKTDPSGRITVTGTMTGKASNGNFTNEPYRVVVMKDGSSEQCESVILGK